METIMTKHCEIYREERIKNIAEKIGIGQIVKECYIRLQGKPYGNFICITDTGVTIIKDESKQKIITMYVTTYKELVSVYNGTKKIPPYLKKKVMSNQNKYIRNGKTIW